MIEVREAAAGDEPAWQGLLGRSMAGDFLHDWSWAAVAAHDGEPQRRFVAHDYGELVAICAAQVRSTIAGRTYWYVPHGPVLDYEHASAAVRLRAVVGALREEARAGGAIVVKFEPRLEAGASGAAAIDAAGLRHEDWMLQVQHTRVVGIERDDETLLASFDKDTRYAIRRAAREGVEVETVDDADDTRAIDAMHDLVRETQRRAGFPLPPPERYRIAWRALAVAGRAQLFEARHEGRLLASAMLVIEGQQSFYLFAGSRREQPGEPKRYASYALQWAMMRAARDRGSRLHDLWGIAPPDAGADHPWFGVGLFKKGFGGRAVAWGGSWDLVVSPAWDAVRRIAAQARGILRR